MNPQWWCPQLNTSHIYDSCFIPMVGNWIKLYRTHCPHHALSNRSHTQERQIHTPGKCVSPGAPSFSASYWNSCPALLYTAVKTPETLSYTAARRRRGRWEQRWRRRERGGGIAVEAGGAGGAVEKRVGRDGSSRRGRRRGTEEGGEMLCAATAETLSAPPSSSSVFERDKQEQDNIKKKPLNICSPQGRWPRLHRSGGKRLCDWCHRPRWSGYIVWRTTQWHWNNSWPGLFKQPVTTAPDFSSICTWICAFSVCDLVVGWEGDEKKSISISIYQYI